MFLRSWRIVGGRLVLVANGAAHFRIVQHAVDADAVVFAAVCFVGGVVFPRLRPRRNVPNVNQFGNVVGQPAVGRGPTARRAVAAALVAEHVLQDRQIPVVDAARFAVGHKVNGDLYLGKTTFAMKT